MNDIAYPNAGTIAVSPDGDHLAFQLRWAVPERNSYCLAMVVLDLRSGRSRVVDQGGELIRAVLDFRGKAGFPSGLPLPIAPRWSADGRWITFLKRAGPAVQVWRAAAEGGDSAPITRSRDDVVDFRIGSDGRSVVFATRPGLREADAAIDREGLSGYHYDDRYSPMSRNRPFPGMAAGERRYFAQPIEGGNAFPADTAAARAQFDIGERRGEVRAQSGRRAWLREDPRAPIGTMELVAEDGAGREIACSACGGRVTSLWWTGAGGALRFLRREGWAESGMGLYEWTPGDDAPQKLARTTDVLADCVPRGSAILCLREGSTRPRRIEAFDLGSGRWSVLFDPNPEFRHLTLGRVERLEWKNSFGIESFGDLVLPVGYRKGTRYPLVVVQYESRGFLRGGTGDDYPIQLFANRGYAVLSFNRPRSLALSSSSRDPTALGRINLEDFADRRSVQSSLEIAVQMIVDRGIADPKRIGITGLSDGMSTVQFALLNSTIFSAAAVSSPGWDPTFLSFVGPAAASHFVGEGYPSPLSDAAAFWRRISIARNARDWSVPILFQLSDDEYLAALEAFTALRDGGAPADLFVFPGEHHVKWQPAHRLAIYRRSVDWFDYWLQGKRSSDQDRYAEFGHWDALAAGSSARPGGSVDVGTNPSEVAKP